MALTLTPIGVVRAARQLPEDDDWGESEAVIELANGVPEESLAQRGKNRPNRLGLTTVRVLGVAGRSLRVAELDAIDGTPVLDIKPVMAEFLPRTAVRQPAWSRELMRDYWRVPGLTAQAGERPAVTVRPAQAEDAPFIRSLAPRLMAAGMPPWRDPTQARGFHIGGMEAVVAALTTDTVLIATRDNESLGVIHLQE